MRLNMANIHFIASIMILNLNFDFKDVGSKVIHIFILVYNLIQWLL